MSLPITYHKLEAVAISRSYRESIAIREVPLEAPTEQEVLIKNHYAGVNASDVNLIAGQYFADATVPYDLGFEFTGEVVAVGSAVTKHKVGDTVMGIKIGGGYREYVTLNEAEAIPVPEASPQLMSLLTVGLAASIGLEHVGEMKRDETILITAASGGVGHLAVQLAKQAGNHVIGTCGSAAKAQFLTSLGCDRVINYRQERVDEVLTQEYPNGIHLVFENVGGALFDTSVKHLAKLGRLIICGFVSEYTNGAQTVNAPRIYHQLLWKSASVRGFLYSDFPELIPQHLGKLIQLMTQQQISVQIDSKAFVGLESVVEAMDYLYQGKNTGRVVVKLQ